MQLSEGNLLLQLPAVVNVSTEKEEEAGCPRDSGGSGVLHDL